jgi:Zn-dependent peptidase ImmA (M78 family)
MPTKEKSKAAEDANRILEIAWKVEPVPIPVDPVRIATTLGVAVFNQELDSDISGAIVKADGSDPVILLNAADSPNRKRFTCAHEIGHFIARSNKHQDCDYEFVDLRGILATMGNDPDEIYANEFAACLLMPQSEVTRMVSDGDLPAQMAVKFGVSTEAVSYRIKNLGLV